MTKRQKYIGQPAVKMRSKSPYILDQNRGYPLYMRNPCAESAKIFRIALNKASRQRRPTRIGRCCRTALYDLLAQAESDLDQRVQGREAVGADEPVVVVFTATARVVDQGVRIGDERDDGTIKLRGEAILAQA